MSLIGFRRGLREKTENLPVAQDMLIFSRAGNGSPEGRLKTIQILRRSKMKLFVGLSIFCFLVEPGPSFGERVKRPPQEAIHGNDHYRHHGNAKSDPWVVSSFCHVSDVGAQSTPTELGWPPTDRFRNDAGIPCAA